MADRFGVSNGWFEVSAGDKPENEAVGVAQRKGGGGMRHSGSGDACENILHHVRPEGSMARPGLEQSDRGNYFRCRDRNLNLFLEVVAPNLVRHSGKLEIHRQDDPRVELAFGRNGHRGCDGDCIALRCGHVWKGESSLFRVHGRRFLWRQMAMVLLRKRGDQCTVCDLPELRAANIPNGCQ